MTNDEVDYMKSVNFEFLRSRWNELASLGGFAEAYAHPDPVASLVKLRTFCEQLVEFIYSQLRLPRAPKSNLYDLLESDAFQAVIPRVVVSKLHALRIHGNHAAHGDKVSAKSSLWLLRESHDLGKWLLLTYGDGRLADVAEFAEPPAGGIESAERRREKRAVLERLAAQEAQMQQLLVDLETTRSRASAAEANVAELQELQSAAAAAGRQAVDVLSFDEATTRLKIIDAMLADARWNLDDPEEVKREVAVREQPTASGLGYADYVLYGDDGRPLAVIEAKKTAIDPEAGRTQAKLYADGLEKEPHGQRPIILYTNGYDIWIWDDAQGDPPRKLYAYYSKDSLDYLVKQRSLRKPLAQVAPNPDIAGRMYQIEAVRRVVETFAQKKRRALLVQATGTGKTRVAVSLCDALIRAGWAMRVLFLCDRRELRKQAHNVFKEFLPSEPRTYVSAATSDDRGQRIYLATYPAMMKCFESFDAGFFDLIIADESHRSIYNRYRDIFEYFDAYQVGLTATPVNHVSRDTYRMFGCEALDPTFNFGYEEAVQRGFLVPFEVETLTTPFLRDGIKYAQMSKEQREQLDDDEPDPTLIDFEREEIDKRVFNKDTNRLILENLMTRGIRDAAGMRTGKSIIFGRNHNHAVLLQKIFDENYPQYGGKFCRVIDNYDPRAEELIDEFKNPQSDLTIAISVDMLDTGIDVPEVVNLVFAKPVFSFVKFWQMIGRGTRLCPNLFGPGADKSHFLIFDHWGNFEWFEQSYKPSEPAVTKSLKQLVFESRIRLAEAALDVQNLEAFNLATSLVLQDILALPEKTIAVREKWKEVKSVGRSNVLNQFEAAAKAILTQEIAPLMQWCNIAGYEEAHKFDNLVAKLQTEFLRGSSNMADHKDELLNQLSQLRVNLSQVQVKLPIIERVKRADFWAAVSVPSLEKVREELRGIVQFRDRPSGVRLPPKVLDVREDQSLIDRKKHAVQLEGLDLVAYRNRVLKVLTDLFAKNETLQRIKAGQTVSSNELEALCSLVLTQDPQLDLHDLEDYYPEFAGQLDQAIRGIIGLDAIVVQQQFTKFVQDHPSLASHQIKFLDLLQNHIAKYGSIEIERLYEPPFTVLNAEGLDGVFPDESIAQELLNIIGSFKPHQ